MAGVRSGRSNGLDSTGNVCYHVNVQVNDQCLVCRSTLHRLLIVSIVIPDCMVVRSGKSPGPNSAGSILWQDCCQGQLINSQGG